MSILKSFSMGASKFMGRATGLPSVNKAFNWAKKHPYLAGGAVLGGGMLLGGLSPFGSAMGGTIGAPIGGAIGGLAGGYYGKTMASRYGRGYYLRSQMGRLGGPISEQIKKHSLAIWETLGPKGQVGAFAGAVMGAIAGGLIGGNKHTRATNPI